LENAIIVHLPDPLILLSATGGAAVSSRTLSSTFHSIKPALDTVDRRWYYV